PKPLSAKRAKESNSKGTPARISKTPSHLKGEKCRSGARMCQREIHQGTSPATVPGAITRKKTVPTTAETRLTVSELNATEPWPVPPPSLYYIWTHADRLIVRPVRRHRSAGSR